MKNMQRNNSIRFYVTRFEVELMSIISGIFRPQRPVALASWGRIHCLTTHSASARGTADS